MENFKSPEHIHTHSQMLDCPTHGRWYPCLFAAVGGHESQLSYLHVLDDRIRHHSLHHYYPHCYCSPRHLPLALVLTTRDSRKQGAIVAGRKAVAAVARTVAVAAEWVVPREGAGTSCEAEVVAHTEVGTGCTGEAVHTGVVEGVDRCRPVAAGSTVAVEPVLLRAVVLVPILVQVHPEGAALAAVAVAVVSGSDNTGGKPTAVADSGEQRPVDPLVTWVVADRTDTDVVGAAADSKPCRAAHAGTCCNAVAGADGAPS